MRRDELNRLKYVIYPGGKRIDYSYDEAISIPSPRAVGPSRMIGPNLLSFDD
jgi:hypothetical protein